MTLLPLRVKRLPFKEVGTASSGDRGHEGRKGLVGGSAAGDGPPENRTSLLLSLWKGGRADYDPGHQRDAPATALRVGVNRFLGNRDFFSRDNVPHDDVTGTQSDAANKVKDDVGAIHDYAAKQWDAAHPDGGELFRGVSISEATALDTEFHSGDGIFTMPPIITGVADSEAAQYHGVDMSHVLGTPGEYRFNVLDISGIKGDRVLMQGDSGHTRPSTAVIAPTPTMLFGATPWKVQDIIYDNVKFRRTFKVVPYNG